MFLGTIMTVMGYTLLMPPTFEAQASLMVKIGREHMYRSEFGGITPALPFDQERIVESEIQILSSRDLTQRVIETLGIAAIYPEISENPPREITPLEAAIRKMQDHLSVAKVRDSNVIKVTFENRSPTLASQSLSLLVNFFKEKHLEVFSNPKASFLEKQLIVHQNKLKASKSALQSFKQEHGLSSLEEERRLLLEQRRDLDAKLKETNHTMYGLTSKLHLLKKQISQISVSTSLESVSARERVIDETKAHLLSLRLKEQDLSTRYKAKSRFVENIRKEISMVETFIDDQESHLTDTVKTGKNPVYQALELEILRAESERTFFKTQAEEITEQLQELNKTLASFDELEKELSTLQLNVDSDQQNYATYLAKVEEARVSEEMDQLKMANISIIQPPTVPEKPVKPSIAVNFLLGIFAGGVAGLVFAFVSEHFERGYSRPEFVSQDLGLPILSSIRYKG
ncbi:MAG: GumC family protein [Nitrospirales bacterium]|nr:GumC family protein [Nitrospirales bacterium]